MSRLKILYVEDDPNDADLVNEILIHDGLEVEIVRVDSKRDFLQALPQDGLHLIFSDVSLPGFDGMTALGLAREIRPDLPFILISGTVGEDFAVESMKAGATDYVMKARLSKLPLAVRRALKEQQELAERRGIEQQLREAESKYRNLVEKVPAIVYMAEFGSQGKWRYVSPQVKSLLGFGPDEIVGTPGLWSKQIHPEDAGRVLDQEARSASTGEAFVCEYRLLTRTADVVWVRDEAIVMPDENARPSLIQGILVDITQIKKAAEDQARLEQQLRQSQKMEAVGQLAGGLAHDFNNILMAIMGYCELMRFHLSNEGELEYDLKEIEKVAQQGSNLTRQLLALGRKQVFQLKILNLNHVVEELEKMLRRLIGDNIELHLALRQDVGEIKADKGQIEQVIMNLVINSRDAMPNGGSITIGTGMVQINRKYADFNPELSEGEYLLLSVEDNGSGMDTNTLSHIFEPFFTTKEKGKGTGLGLSTVYGIVKQTGGHISVDSKPGVGTTFRIYFPCIAPLDGSKQKEREDEQAKSNDLQTLLIVDDNEAVRSAIYGFVSAFGYNVMMASSTNEAIHIAKQPGKRIDLLITDMVVSGPAGQLVAQQMRQLHPGVKVIYMSGSPKEGIDNQRIAGPDVVFIEKPAAMASLLRTIRELLDS